MQRTDAKLTFAHSHGYHNGPMRKTRPRPSLVRELTAQLHSLERERHDIDAQIAAIRVLLKRAPQRRAANHAQALIPAPQGLRDALRKLLSVRPHAPSEAIKALRKGGFESLGKTPFPTRVYNELGRMRRDGLIKERDSEGRYALAS